MFKLFAQKGTRRQGGGNYEHPRSEQRLFYRIEHMLALECKEKERPKGPPTPRMLSRNQRDFEELCVIRTHII